MASLGQTHLLEASRDEDQARTWALKKAYINKVENQQDFRGVGASRVSHHTSYVDGKENSPWRHNSRRAPAPTVTVDPYLKRPGNVIPDRHLVAARHVDSAVGDNLPRSPAPIQGEGGFAYGQLSGKQEAKYELGTDKEQVNLLI